MAQSGPAGGGGGGGVCGGGAGLSAEASLSVNALQPAAAEKEIARLEALIEQLTAKIAELKTIIEETTKELEADKEELATATELRQKQLKAFHGEELDAIQNVENLKAAIIVLGKRACGDKDLDCKSENQ